MMSIIFDYLCLIMGGSIGGTGGLEMKKNHKNIVFLSNTGPDPRKCQSYQASIQCRGIISMPGKHHLLNGVSLTGR